MSRLIRSRFVSLLPLVIVLALLPIELVERSAAGLAIFWRAAVLSWDNPVTQMQDEAASQAVSHTDPGRQARDSSALIFVPTGRVHLVEPPAGPCDPARASRLTRSPPLA